MNLKLVKMLVVIISVRVIISFIVRLGSQSRGGRRGVRGGMWEGGGGGDVQIY